MLCYCSSGGCGILFYVLCALAVVFQSAAVLACGLAERLSAMVAVLTSLASPQSPRQTNTCGYHFYYIYI